MIRCKDCKHRQLIYMQGFDGFACSELNKRLVRVESSIRYQLHMPDVILVPKDFGCVHSEPMQSSVQKDNTLCNLKSHIERMVDELRPGTTLYRHTMQWILTNVVLVLREIVSYLISKQ